MITCKRKKESSDKRCLMWMYAGKREKRVGSSRDAKMGWDTALQGSES